MGRNRFADLQKRSLRLGIGTEALGNVDNTVDGEETRRNRRKVIVLKQKKGVSLDLTFQSSTELKNLGLTFTKWQVPSPASSTKSSKNKKIILRRVNKEELMSEDLNKTNNMSE